MVWSAARSCTSTLDCLMTKLVELHMINTAGRSTTLVAISVIRIGRLQLRSSRIGATDEKDHVLDIWPRLDLGAGKRSSAVLRLVSKRDHDEGGREMGERVGLCGKTVIPEAGHVRLCMLKKDHPEVDHETIFRMKIYRWRD